MNDKVLKSEISNLEHHLGYWLRLVSTQVSQSFAAKLEQSGVTVAEWVILRRMFDHSGDISPRSVAESTGLTKGAISKLIDRLVTKELVSRQTVAADRRYQDIRLTEKARLLVPQLARLADENDSEFFSELSDRESRQLLTILKKIAAGKINKVPIQ